MLFSMEKRSKYKALAIITSAGKSSRMGQPKALLPFDENHTFIEQIVATYSEQNIATFVVTNELLAPALAPLVAGAGGFLAPCAKPEWQMIDSLRYGLSCLPVANLPLFIQPVDMPFISAPLLKAMLELVAKKPEAFIVPMTPAGPGHPLLIPPGRLNWLKSPATAGGLKKALSELKEPPLPLAWSDSRLALNINTPEDYKKLGL